jgi:hypothetical protein
MTTRTAEEAKTNYIEKMGEPLGNQFAAFWQEVEEQAEEEEAEDERERI